MRNCFLPRNSYNKRRIEESYSLFVIVISTSKKRLTVSKENKVGNVLFVLLERKTSSDADGEGCASSLYGSYVVKLCNR